MRELPPQSVLLPHCAKRAPQYSTRTTLDTSNVGSGLIPGAGFLMSQGPPLGDEQGFLFRAEGNPRAEAHVLTTLLQTEDTLEPSQNRWGSLFWVGILGAN